ncbi:hypothetical protein FDW83_17270 [Pseudarthrobacter sp. NamE2]|uniref:hypothetical protein n=1 Tax=Pseudarthrobacter sp. NamE2 TaxID=2576838 RepID=UPI0010FE033B|nr:hypothetical protein [Pseudarthrobacter sp. NamE2]TLM81119.1 hypothetical protein FDW83_17270 [Pseudarthrobacter sp. NamE2]
MGEARSPWRALRPVLLAGAAAFTWLSFSSTAASADTLPDTSSLLGGVTGSVTSVTENLVPAVPAPPASTPAAPPASGLVQPIVGQLSGGVDDLITAFPVVNQVVPAGTVSSVSAPVAHIADGATATLAETVVPPVAEAIPVLEPVANLVTGTAPLPAPVPELPAVVVEDGAPVLPEPAAADLEGASLEAADAASGESAVEIRREQAPASAVTAAGALAVTSAFPAAAEGAALMRSGDTAPAHPSSYPIHAPAVPGSGAGSGGLTGGGSGSAAWLSLFDFAFPLAGLVIAGEAPDHALAPVSFDPGSSPD